MPKRFGTTTRLASLSRRAPMTFSRMSLRCSVDHTPLQRRTMEKTMQNDNAVLAADRVAKARAELILARTFYGVLVSQVQPIASTNYPTMATDGRRHFYNPDFIARLTQAELLGVQAHESEHDARRHHTRRGSRDPVKWNEACDYAINVDLITEGFTLPKGALIDERFRGMSAEDIYRTRELDQQQQQQPQEQEE